ncbi:hypothetical protein BDY21DRAFT_363377 [Lineolata rhizophorae]|uniref:NACHT-NTPase and P-loop NTPases N-terminal domain-containing protein n=1 Tax=Lineolata rhizophorae TaxID=578093 RepID=A0A6A6P1U8_9PEZI|nr:hypothetical protein BDY21DRAFT_363377 [Lineolata rhizophorae]
MEVGASVLAFITVGLRSTGAIYRVVSGIKDGPEETGLDKKDMDELLKALGNCNSEVEKIAAKLEKLQETPSDSRMRRTWKQVRTFFQKDDFESMRQTIQWHVSCLHARFSFITSDVQSAVRANGFTSTGFTGLARDSQAAAASATTSLPLYPPSLTSIDNRNQVVELSNAQQSQQSTYESEALQDDRRIVDIEEEEAEKEQYTQFLESIKNLSKLAESKERVASSSDAEDIISDLNQLLNAASKQLDQQNDPGGFQNRKRKRVELVDDSENAHLNVDLKKLCRLANASDKVTINQRPPQTLPQSRAVGKHYYRRINQSFNIAGVNVDLKTRKRYRVANKPRSIRPENDDQTSEHDELVEMTASVHVIAGTGANSKITTYFTQTMNNWGFHTLNPIIVGYRRVPNDSPIFKLVEKGDIHGLLCLVQEGKASLRDYDEEDRSLLGAFLVTEISMQCSMGISN